MARSAVISNGCLAVGFDENGLVHDFYYPYVGLENIQNARLNPHYVGIWIDGSFSWLHNEPWQNSTELLENEMVVKTIYKNQKEQIEIIFESFIDHRHNALFRTSKISNNSEKNRQIRLFMHQVFQISSEGRADTALYVPDDNYILDYKGRVSLLINMQIDSNKAFDQYAVGNFGIEGKEGTYKDAEDGELSMSAVEHAGVDSVIRIPFDLLPHGSQTVNYWIIASDSHYAARKLNESIVSNSVEKRRIAHEQHWKTWLEPAKPFFNKLEGEQKKLAIASLWTIKAHIDKHGGIIAACDSSIYNYGRDFYSYVWPRDGAFVLWPLIRLGFHHEAKNFFEFCRDIISPDGYLLHKYQPDKAVGSTWHPLVHGEHSELAIQEDETALVLFMLGEYADYSDDTEFVRSLYESLIRPAANFLSEYIDEHTLTTHPSYDLWEEKFLSTTFSSGATYKALLVSAKFAKLFGFIDDHDKWKLAARTILSSSELYFSYDRRAFRKGFRPLPDGSLKFDDTLDISSLYAAFMFDFTHDKSFIKDTATAIENELLDISPTGGLARYENDNYFKNSPQHKGNPWFVATLWMAQYYHQLGDFDKTLKYLNWTMAHATNSGMLSEQVNPNDGKPVGVTPLVWSHAEMLNTLLDVHKQK